MRTFDLSPFNRGSIGFDRMNRVLENLSRLEDNAPAYPPYNIEKVDENNYRIVMAVAGFSDSDLDITVKDGALIVSGKIQPDGDDTVFLHRGIAGRAFERRFELADHIEVKGASLENGLLTLELVREVPEALKPRTISIASGTAKSLEQKAA